MEFIHLKKKKKQSKWVSAADVILTTRVCQAKILQSNENRLGYHGWWWVTYSFPYIGLSWFMIFPVKKKPSIVKCDRMNRPLLCLYKCIIALCLYVLAISWNGYVYYTVTPTSPQHTQGTVDGVQRAQKVMWAFYVVFLSLKVMFWRRDYEPPFIGLCGCNIVSFFSKFKVLTFSSCAHEVTPQLHFYHGVV